MKLLKFSLVAILSLFMIGCITPELSAKHHHRHHGHSSRIFTSFGFNFNFNPIPSYSQSTYVVQQPVIMQPAPVQRVSYVYPACTYCEQVYVERPAYTSRVYVQPQFSYWNY